MVTRDGRDVSASFVSQTFGPDDVFEALDQWERRMLASHRAALASRPDRLAFIGHSVKKAGARFYDLDGNGSADTADLQFVDGGYGDKDGVKNGVVVDPSTAGAVDMNAIFTASANRLTVGDPTDTSPAALVVRASLSSRSSTVNQIGYVALNASETLSLSYDLVKERGTLLFGTLASSGVPDIS
jgi:hypothetical protein